MSDFSQFISFLLMPFFVAYFSRKALKIFLRMAGGLSQDL